ncbi:MULTISPECIES: 30S ribosomal protein S30e [Metallosphaera]|uniref:SSU ribosomal protein S30E n=3 Tax=Metallosphaera TaxID=41980 RepID=A4YHH4_METS5|nr:MULTISPECIES: 30S ribosomal protein S30e [Metallosphaera]ABP95876.1 SSU ribosomal protein S30E [Metallosphaera sedula DSM 5348]AIM27860.1 SSU ribosomal protein S30E [Metallosphaera sedula]AKV74703.1 30S ribosomal protein S30 [Metallosphaera sedula]AKV76941.1 30S ribosomal protein S30 [Metallosphaera sedula]AKV79192.1 30S ribosomal protein S30 [Metallosphaera sedula]
MPSHGSLTKAGKVRGQTPKIQAKERHKEVPRVRNRIEYEKRVLKQTAQKQQRAPRRM